MPRRSLESFVCPISQEVMKDPVVACDGHSYEREDIETWFAQKVTSPSTNAPLPSSTLVPNHALRLAIQEYACHNPRASSPASSPTLAAFCCPIGKAAMVDPVVAADGYSYDRGNIKDRKVFLGMFTKRSKSPLTNYRLNLRHVVPNHALKAAIAEFNGEPAPSELSPSSIEIYPAFTFEFSPHSLSSPPLPAVSSNNNNQFSQPWVTLSPDQPPSVYRVVRETSVLWSQDTQDTMPSEIVRPLPVDSLLVGLVGRGSSFVEVDGDAIGSLVDTAYVALADLELVEAMEVRMRFCLRRRAALALWPTDSTAHVLAWMEVGDVVSSEAVVLDATGQAYHRCQDTKCWLRIEEGSHLAY